MRHLAKFIKMRIAKKDYLYNYGFKIFKFCNIFPKMLILICPERYKVKLVHGSNLLPIDCYLLLKLIDKSRPLTYNLQKENTSRMSF